MFYRMIETARDKWYSSPECTVLSVTNYIETKGSMRDAQIDAIKTYLYLKIACEDKPLAKLFADGKFNSIAEAAFDDLEISNNTRNFLKQNKAAAALFEYSRLRNDKGEQVSKKLEEAIKKTPQTIDYNKFFYNAFYGVSYTDYLFSLPMGAGKTYLMAAFIYLDLYFARLEPDNPIFAHNFIVFAPSGLKSSVVPSLRTIQRFEPSWILPEPAASEIKRELIFEVLDENKTASKSNKTKNPNVQKIANHQPFRDLFGLVAVTNAEKVILDSVLEKDGQAFILDNNERSVFANELRALIGQLPSLSVFIDEVHHAVSDEIKLRAVVNKWADGGSINSVIGFSGTPYLEKTEKITVTEDLSVATTEITNTVYYYPLVNGVGNFLKRPDVKISETAESERIIETGTREFLNKYKDTVYSGGLAAKLGIYCGTIEKLEETVYPLVSRIAAEYGISADAILKFHRGNKKYPQPQDSQLQYDSLDKPFSKIRIILLVQIGKEGWDCRSLTGIILSQEGDCPKNMVLQTSCRCLRQVVKNSDETALIYLNGDNGKKLEEQLGRQQHITIKEFMNGNAGKTRLNRYNRMERLKLPPIDFYQLSVKYGALVVENATPAQNIPAAADGTQINPDTVRMIDLSLHRVNTVVDDEEHGTIPAAFNGWLYEIAKESFGFLTVDELLKYETELRGIFEKITFVKAKSRCYSSKYNISAVRANIRKAFADKREWATDEEFIPTWASLLNIANFTNEIYTDDTNEFCPEQDIVEKIIADDNGKLVIDEKTAETIKSLEELGQAEMAETLRRQNSSHPQKDRSFHYLPYHTDSSFEQKFLTEILGLEDVDRLGLEVYYNGDRELTEFKIKCYKQGKNGWQDIGFYTPDFLIIQRKNGEIYKAAIVETKGQIYANDPVFKEKKKFTETEFIIQNNKAFNYRRFDYLYLEDSDSEQERLIKTHSKIKEFFGGEE